jgi:hypothetical protein
MNVSQQKQITQGYEKWLKTPEYDLARAPLPLSSFVVGSAAVTEAKPAAGYPHLRCMAIPIYGVPWAITSFYLRILWFVLLLCVLL